MIPSKIPYCTPQKLPGVFEESSLTVLELSSKVAGAINQLIDEMTAYEENVNSSISEQNEKIEQYKSDLEDIVKEYEEIVNNDISNFNKNALTLYNKTVDVYNKTVIETQLNQQYVNTALLNLGSIANWEIIGDVLAATVYNGDVIKSFGMTNDGRLEVTTNV